MLMLGQVELPYPTGTGNTSVRHAAGRHYLSKEAMAYRMAVAQRVGRRTPLRGPLHMDWLIAPPDQRRRDHDNLEKVAGDALVKAGFIEDDSNQVIVSGAWRWTDPVKGGAILVTAYRA
jgi:Holliday junction resolvase RusA-like endonuclease